MRNGRRDWGLVTVAALSLTVVSSPYLAPASAQDATPSLSDRVGRYVEEYYRRAQSLVAEETVTIERLGPDLASRDLPRRLVYEMHLEWRPDKADDRATVVRDLMRVGSRSPKKGWEPECLDPKGVSPEPLAFLLVDRRHEYVYREVGTGRSDGREALLLDYLPARPAPPTLTGDKDCISIDMPMRTRGRLWVAPGTHEVLRLDEQVVGPTDVPVPRQFQSANGFGAWVTVERSDTSIRYRPVRFTEPDESLMLPVSIDSISVIRSTGIQRLRVRQTYRNYRRFLTTSRVVPGDDTAPTPTR